MDCTDTRHPILRLKACADLIQPVGVDTLNKRQRQLFCHCAAVHATVSALHLHSTLKMWHKQVVILKSNLVP